MNEYKTPSGGANFSRLADNQGGNLSSLKKTSMGQGANFPSRPPVEVETPYGKFSSQGQNKQQLAPASPASNTPRQYFNQPPSVGTGIKILIVILSIVTIVVAAGLAYIYFDLNGKISKVSGGSNGEGEMNLLEQQLADLQEKIKTIESTMVTSKLLGKYVASEDFENMREVVMKIDSDGDGLYDYEEIHIYKTDPNNSDTDGDGYSDKDEIDGGYDPLGPGKLEEAGVVGVFTGELSGDVEASEVSLSFNKNGTLEGSMKLNNEGQELPSILTGDYTYDSKTGEVKAKTKGSVTLEGKENTYSLELSGNYDKTNFVLSGSWLSDNTTSLSWLAEQEGEFQLTKQVQDIVKTDYQGEITGDLEAADLLISIMADNVIQGSFTLDHDGEEMVNDFTGSYKYDSTKKILSADVNCSMKEGGSNYKYSMTIEMEYDGTSGKLAGTYAVPADSEPEWIAEAEGGLSAKTTKVKSVSDENVVGNWKGGLETGKIKSDNFLLVLSGNGQFIGEFSYPNEGQIVENDITGTYTYSEDNEALELTGEVVSLRGIDSANYKITLNLSLDKDLKKLDGTANFVLTREITWLSADETANVKLNKESTLTSSDSLNSSAETNTNSVNFEGLNLPL